MLTCTSCNHRVSARATASGAHVTQCPRCGGALRRVSPRDAARAAMRGAPERDLHTVLRRRLLGHGG